MAWEKVSRRRCGGGVGVGGYDEKITVRPYGGGGAGKTKEEGEGQLSGCQPANTRDGVSSSNGGPHADLTNHLCHTGGTERDDVQDQRQLLIICSLPICWFQLRLGPVRRAID